MRVVLILMILVAGCCTPHPKEHPKAPDLATILGELNLQDYNKDSYGAPFTPFTEPVLLIENDVVWKANEVQVPIDPGKKAAICFRIQGIRAVECFYKDLKSEEVEMKWVLLKGEKV